MAAQDRADEDPVTLEEIERLRAELEACREERDRLAREALAREHLARRQAEELAAKVEADRTLLDAVVRQMPTGVIVAKAPSGSVLVGNEQVARIFGHPLLPSNSVEDYAEWKGFHADGRPYAPEEWPMARAVRKGETVTAEEVVIERGDGTRGVIQISAAPIREGEQVVAGVVVFEDITERKRTEDALRENEAFLRNVIDTTPSMIFVKDWEGRFVFANEALARCYGTTVEGVLGKTDADFNPDSSEVAHFLRNDREVMSSRRPKLIPEELVTCAEGPTRWFSTVKVPLIEDGACTRVLGVATDITKRKRAEEELARSVEAERLARAEAQEANQAKDQFVALVSHELRNPLSAITAGLGVLRHTLPAEAPARRTLEIIERNVKLQTRLINDLLDLSRLSRGELQLQRAPVELWGPVYAAIQAHETEAQQTGITLTSAVDRGLWVQGDSDRLQQVVMNLLSNALKFTPPGGTVRVECKAHDAGHARIAVGDTGVGISPDLLGQLFRMFQQGEVAGQRRPGLGIGLALVKGIVERHGGRVWAESEGVGKGSCFTVELPLVERPVVSPPVRRAESPSRVGVLLVEDNPDTRATIADSLTLAGYDVETAGSAEAALEILGETRPEIILADIGLPGMDGYEFLRRARLLPGIADVPAFAITGYGSQEDVRRSQEAGYAGHFVKPVNVRVLDQRIREWVSIQDDAPEEE